ncbi:hypothetical protein AB1046_09000 [Promicromonospora sp. Populi]|uniref:hypothetical protein n=1 Tax=Promicromonospora sp. Populi TaxID=3239420 RepID=UPI0034E211FA
MNDRFDSAPDVEPLSADRRQQIRTAVLEGISARPERSSRRHVAQIGGAMVAVAVLGVGVVIGTNVLRDQQSLVPLAAAAGSVPVSIAECSPAETTDPSALEGATYLLQAPTPAALSDVWMTVDECPRATPVAAYYRADGSPDDAVLTIWSGDAQTPLGPLENFEGAERVSLSSGTDDAWLVDLGWGVWVEWRTDSDSYLVTSAGLDRDTVMSVARSYDGETSAEAAALAPPGLEAITPLPSSDRDATWYAQYGNPDPTEKDGEPWVQIQVELSGAPWAAHASVNPIPDDGLSVPAPAGTAVRSGDNGGFRYATWTTDTGAEVQLMANLSEAEVLELASDLELVGPHDPLLERFDLTSPRTGGPAL